jgi:predicted O-methyltransferase YrrM
MKIMKRFFLLLIFFSVFTANADDCEPYQYKLYPSQHDSEMLSIYPCDTAADIESAVVSWSYYLRDEIRDWDNWDWPSKVSPTLATIESNVKIDHQFGPGGGIGTLHDGSGQQKDDQSKPNSVYYTIQDFHSQSSAKKENIAEIANNFSSDEGGLLTQHTSSQRSGCLAFAAAVSRATSYLEVGFNIGGGLTMLLGSVPTIKKVAEYDICIHDDTLAAYSTVKRLHPNIDISLTCGNSIFTIPDTPSSVAHESWDVIHIDGGHDYPVAYADILNLWRFARSDGGTILVIDDAGTEEVREKENDLAFGFPAVNYAIRKAFIDGILLAPDSPNSIPAGTCSFGSVFLRYASPFDPKKYEELKLRPVITLPISNKDIGILREKEGEVKEL